MAPYLDIVAPLYLVLMGLGFAFFGLRGVLSPQTVVDKLSLQATHASGLTAIRAVYGGFHLGVGALLIYMALAPGLLAMGLVAVIAISSALILCRAYGMAVDGNVTSIHWTYLSFELAALLLTCGVLAIVWGLGAG